MAKNIGENDMKEENVLDLSIVPAVVTFKNAAKEDGGYRRIISISGQNQQLPIEAGQTIKLKAESSSELIGYLSQEDETLDVSFDKAE